MMWAAFWIAWAIGGFTLGVAVTRALGDELPSYWTVWHVCALIAACGPIIWAAMLAVVIGDRR